MELADAPTVRGEQLAAAVDRALCEHHYDYAKMRATGAYSAHGLGLGPPLVILLPPGSFRRWLDRRLDGGTGAQSKTPRLTHDIEPAAELVTLAGRATVEPQLAAYPPHYGEMVRRFVTAA